MDMARTFPGHVPEVIRISSDQIRKMIGKALESLLGGVCFLSIEQGF